MDWISKWRLWRSSIYRAIEEVGKAVDGVYFKSDYYESHCGWVVPFVPLDIRFWRLGTSVDSGQLQIASRICYADVSNHLPNYFFRSPFFLTKRVHFQYRFPLVMNIMQFWVIDTFIKHKSVEKASPTIRLDHDEEDAQTLLRQDEEEEEEDDEEPADPPPDYNDDDRMNHLGGFLQASSSSDIPTSRGNEYELKSKNH